MKEFFIDNKELEIIERELKKQPAEMARAAVAAINKTLTLTKNKWKTEISKTYNISKEDLEGSKKFKSEKSNNLIKIRKATYTNMGGYIDIRGKTLNMGKRFLNIQEPTNKDNRAAQNVEIKRGVAKGISKAKTSTKPFAAIETRNNVLGIFKRNPKVLVKGKDGYLRHGIMMLRTLSPATMARNTNVIEPTKQKAQKVLIKKIMKEIENSNKRLENKLK